MKRLKDVLAEAIYDTFNIPVHYTTLSENEYEEMYALRQENSVYYLNITINEIFD